LPPLTPDKGSTRFTELTIFLTSLIISPESGHDRPISPNLGASCIIFLSAGDIPNSTRIGCSTPLPFALLPLQGECPRRRSPMGKGEGVPTKAGRPLLPHLQKRIS
jgi:hypothetical protein